MIQKLLLQHQEEDADVSRLLKDSFYVDDFAVRAENGQKAIYNKSQRIMNEGGFRLRKRNSNSNVLKDKIKKDTLSCTAQTNTSIDSEGDENIYSQERKTREPVTILGCGWNVVTDKFHFRVRELIEYAKSLPPTKRSV